MFAEFNPASEHNMYPSPSNEGSSFFHSGRSCLFSLILPRYAEYLIGIPLLSINKPNEVIGSGRWFFSTPYAHISFSSSIS